MKRRPPLVATWFLEVLGSDPRNDQMVGDLIERYSRGRSRSWYWRQMVAAIATSFLQQLRSQWLMVISALIAGWCLWSILAAGLNAGLNAVIHPWEKQLPIVVAALWWTGWLANRAISGWMIGRFYSKSRVASVLVFSFSVFLWKAKIVQWPFYIDYEWPLRLVLNTVENVRFLPALPPIILAPLFTFLGGLAGANSQRRRDASSVEDESARVAYGPSTMRDCDHRI